MGANTRLEIDTYLYSPGEGKVALLVRLLRGAMVYVSGKMASLSPGSTKVETPVGVVGLRGTEVAITVEIDKTPFQTATPFAWAEPRCPRAVLQLQRLNALLAADEQFEHAR